MMFTHHMVAHRLFKQIVYLGLALALLFAGVTAVFWLFVHPATPAPLPSPTLSPHKPIVVEEVTVIPHIPVSVVETPTVDIVARLRNPNPTVGVGQYPVVFVIHAVSGAALLSKEEMTYLLPGSLQYVAAVGIPLPTREIGQVEVMLPPQPVWQEVPAAIKPPEFNVFLKNRYDQAIGEAVLEQQRGVIRNVGTFDWEKVEIIALAISADNKVVGVGNTFVGLLQSTQEREFTVQWPKPTQTTVRVITFPSTNIFAEGNISHSIGDPNSLR